MNIESSNPIANAPVANAINTLNSNLSKHTISVSTRENIPLDGTTFYASADGYVSIAAPYLDDDIKLAINGYRLLVAHAANTASLFVRKGSSITIPTTPTANCSAVFFPLQ